MKKFMMTITKEMYSLLEKQAVDRDVSVQEFIRAVVLPEWIKKHPVPLPPISMETEGQAQARPRRE